MARTQIRGGDQILDFTVLKADLTLDFLGGVNWDISNGAANATITGLQDGVNASDAATKGQLDNAIAGIVGMVYQGTFNATLPSPDLATIASKQGDFYKVSVAGTYLGIPLFVGDMMIINKDVAVGAIAAADIDVIDNTEAADILRSGSIVDSLLSSDPTKVLSANQGFVLKGLIDALSAQVNSRKYREGLAVTHNSPNLPALANPPVAGTERVFLNGMLMNAGAGNDYTITGSAITMQYNLKNNDVVLVHYEY